MRLTLFPPPDCASALMVTIYAGLFLIETTATSTATANRPSPNLSPIRSKLKLRSVCFAGLSCELELIHQA